MKKIGIIAVAGLLCAALFLLPARAAETGAAGIHFDEPSENSAPGGGGVSQGGGGGGGVSTGSSGGSPMRDTTPDRRPPDADIAAPEDEPVWMLDPALPEKGLGTLPATGSQRAAGAALVLAGSCMIFAATRRRQP